MGVTKEIILIEMMHEEEVREEETEKNLQTMKRRRTIMVKKNQIVLEINEKTEMRETVNQKNSTLFFMANPLRAKEKSWINMSEVYLGKSKVLGISFLGKKLNLSKGTLKNRNFTNQMKIINIKMVTMIIGTGEVVIKISGSGMVTEGKVQD